MAVAAAGMEIALFDGLKRYSHADVELLNWFHRSFPGTANWQAWVQDALGTLIEAPAGTSICLKQTNQVESGAPQNHHFEQDRVRIGREPDNDIVLALPAIGRHHARILKRDRGYLLEDLGSAAGTYLNSKKLAPNTATPLLEGDRVLIFPHLFEVTLQEIWQSGRSIQVTSPKVIATTWSAWDGGGLSSLCRFGVKVHPAAGVASLAINRGFLEAAVHRATRAPANHLVATDAGLFELLLLSVLERANRELEFPLQFSLIDFAPCFRNERGIGLECCIGLPGVTGVFQLFLPASLLTQMQFGPRGAKTQRQGPISWYVFAMLGYVDLGLEDFGQLEAGDILIMTSDPTLLLPVSRSHAERGWHVLQTGEMQLHIQSYFERNVLMPCEEIGTGKAEAIAKPDLSTLPVRLHIVLGQLELSLAELDALAPGSIVELDRGKSEPVQLAINGKVAGQGELVEVEGKLGVRITGWTVK